MIKTLDDIIFSLKRSDRRTLQITVERDGSIAVSAPLRCNDENVDEFVMKKTFWIYTKLAKKNMLHIESPKKEFVNGEGFPYLGRHYRWRFSPNEGRQVKLKNGYMRCGEPKSHARQSLIAWYTERADEFIGKRIGLYSSHLGLETPKHRILDLKHRWGSCNKAKGVVNFNWRTILAPTTIVDYVIAHELAHLQVHDHSKKFWNLLRHIMPDYVERKEWLATNGALLTI